MSSCFRAFKLEKHGVAGEYCLCSSSEFECAVNWAVIPYSLV